MEQRKVDAAVGKLLEQEPEELDKPFPHRTVPTDTRLSAHGTSMQTQGKPYMIKVYATQHPFPDELFSELDLHSKSGGQPGFLGWVGGAYTAGNRFDRSKMVSFVSQEKTPTQDGKDPAPGTQVPIYRLGATFVEEVQSDIIQRTVAFTTKEKRQTTIKRKLADISSQYGPLYQEYEKTQALLSKLELSARDPQSAEYLKQRLAAEEKLDELLGKLKSLTVEMDKEKKLYPQFAEIRSKVENAFKKWIPAFFNAALRFAKSKDSTFFGIISSDKIKQIWRSNLAGREDTSLFDRIYDGTAQRWGMTRSKQGGQDWWIGVVQDMQPLESVEQVINRLLGEQDFKKSDYPEAGWDDAWKAHLDTFLTAFAAHRDDEPDYDFRTHPEGGSVHMRQLRVAFLYWLDQLDLELLHEETFQDEVNQFMVANYGVDPGEEGWWPLPGISPDRGDDPDPDDPTVGPGGGDAPVPVPVGAMSDEEMDALFGGDYE